MRASILVEGKKGSKKNLIYSVESKKGKNKQRKRHIQQANISEIKNANRLTPLLRLNCQINFFDIQLNRGNHGLVST